MITEEQAAELIRCRNSCDYFARTYGWMRHPTLGPIRFTPWDWQSMLFNLWQGGKSTVANKSRQVGASWCAVAFACWIINFHPEVEILLLSEKEEKAIKLLSKLTFFYDHLPDWMTARTTVDSKTKFSVSMRYYDDTSEKWVQGDGTVSSLTTTGTSGAGDSARLIVVDEFALMTERGNDRAVWSAIAPTTTHGGQVILLSTPRGAAGEFYKIFTAAVDDVVEFGIAGELKVGANYRDWNRAVAMHANRLQNVPLAIHYSMCYHDENWITENTRGLSATRAREIAEHFATIKYDEKWRKDQQSRWKFDDNQMAQEFDLQFEQMGNAAFNTADINACYIPPAQNPWVKDLIRRSSYYYIGVDTAEGISTSNRDADYNSITVFNQSGVQVYAEHNRQTIDEWAGSTVVDPETGKATEVKGTVLKVVERFLPCTVLIEKNGPGLTVQNRVEPHLPGDAEPLVLSMTGGIKPQLVSDFAAEMADEQVINVGGNLRTVRKFLFTDALTVRALRHYVKTAPGKFEAASGFFDDPVVGCLWAAYAKRIRGAIDGFAMLPSERDNSRAIAIDKLEDLGPGELQTAGTYGPAVTANDDLLAGMAMGMRADAWRSLEGASRRGFRGESRRLRGRG